MSEIKIGLFNKSFTTRSPQKSTEYKNIQLKSIATFLGIGEDYISIFSEQIFNYSSVLKNAQGQIVSIISGGGSSKVLHVTGYLKNFSYHLGETIFRTLCDRIERNIGSNRSYNEDLHLLKQEISQVLMKINHLYK